MSLVINFLLQYERHFQEVQAASKRNVNRWQSSEGLGPQQVEKLQPEIVRGTADCAGDLSHGHAALDVE